MGGYNSYYTYKIKTAQDFDNDEKIKKRGELQTFMEQNATKRMIKLGNDIPEYSLRVDREEYYVFHNKELFDEYNERLKDISGGKSKKKVHILKKRHHEDMV
jgi:hypothetical protein